MSEQTTRARWGWTHAALAAAAAAAAVVAGLDAWQDISFIAQRDEEQTHILLAPIIALWMVLARRIRLRTTSPRGSLGGLALILVGAVGSHLGFRYSVDVAWHGGAVLMLIGAIVAVTGRHLFFAFLPAFAVLVFMVPVPGIVRQTIALPLQTWTAIATQAVLETVGVEVERASNVLLVNGQQIAVAEACNGLRMVWALILVTYAFAFSIPLRGTTRALLLLFSPIVAIVGNVARLVPTAALYGFADRDLADRFHDLSGWLMLPLAFLGLLLLVRLLRWALIPVGRFNLAYQ